MRFLVLGFVLFIVSGCATKYMIAGNRFLTPETKGGQLNSQMEIQATTATQHRVNTDDEGGVFSTSVNRTGYLYEISPFEMIDFVWSHTGGANSMLGLKYQFLGSPRPGGVGHKMSLGGLFGANEHELEGDPSVEFKIGGQEYFISYGYRWSEFVMNYASVSRSEYNFQGTISSNNPLINGIKPNYNSSILGGYIGTEVNYYWALAKLECGYQQIETNDTKLFSYLFCGWSFGVQW